MTKTIQEFIDKGKIERNAAKKRIESLIDHNRLVLNPSPQYGVIFEGMTISRWKPWHAGNEYNTALSDDRFDMIMQLEAMAPSGTAVEMGVFTGGVTKFFLNAGRNTWAFDTFAGIAGASAKDDMHADGEYNGGDVLEYIKGARIVKGEIPDSLNIVGNFTPTIAIAHIDLDVKSPTAHALEFVYNHLHDDGVIIVDDYGFASTPGVKAAVDEFPKGRKLYIPTGQMLIWKGR